uniref:Uncharacterized protein n=1 Tax=Ditylenchus dipsaci TaxID=166011 RepID=A0A915DKI0_9BILA
MQWSKEEKVEQVDRYIASPLGEKYVELSANLCKQLLCLYRAQHHIIKDSKKENPLHDDFLSESAYGLTEQWNCAVTKWYEEYLVRSDEAGFTNVGEEQMSCELTVVLRRVFARATAEAAPCFGSRMDVVVSCLKHKFIFIIELGYYFGGVKKAEYFAKDTMPGKKALPFLKSCGQLTEVAPQIKLARKLEQVIILAPKNIQTGFKSFDYMASMTSNSALSSKYTTYCCLAVLVNKHENFRY